MLATVVENGVIKIGTPVVVSMQEPGDHQREYQGRIGKVVSVDESTGPRFYGIAVTDPGQLSGIALLRYLSSADFRVIVPADALERI